MEDAFRNAVGQLFPKVDPDVSGDTPSLQVAIGKVMDKLEPHSGQPYSDCLKVLGLHFLQENDAEEAFLDNIAARSGSSTEHRHRNGFDNLRPYADILSEKERTLSGLIHELRTKFLE